jgi:hypothetical protein
LAFCKSFSISTWLLWRTLQRKLWHCSLSLGFQLCTHTNTWIGFFSYTWKVQESNFFNGLQSTTSGVPTSLFLLCFVKKLGTFNNTRDCWKLDVGKNTVKGTMATKVRVLTKGCILYVLHVLVY